MKRLLLLSIAVPALAVFTSCSRPQSGPGDPVAATNVVRVKDPVCGMEVEPAKALKSDHAGKTYYFCSKNCKDKFDANPAQYATP